jgi:AraC family transcriptional regulator
MGQSNMAKAMSAGSTAAAEAPVPTLSFSTLYASRLLVVRSYQCRACRGQFGGEEHSDAHCMVLLRRGFFRKQEVARKPDKPKQTPAKLSQQTVTADSGQVVFHTCGMPYRVSHPSDCGDSGTVLSLAPTLLQAIIREWHPAIDDHPALPFPQLAMPCSNAHYLQHRALVQALETGAAEASDPLWVETMALSLQAGLLADAYRLNDAPIPLRRGRTEADHHERAEAARAVLSRRLGERLSLADVADEVHLSPFHLARIFRQQAGVSLHRYLNQLRLRTALDRLLDQPCDLAALALEHGFSSHSHFSDLFRREFGFSPSALRQQNWRDLSKKLKATLVSTR